MFSFSHSLSLFLSVSQSGTSQDGRQVSSALSEAPGGANTFQTNNPVSSAEKKAEERENEPNSESPNTAESRGSIRNKTALSYCTVCKVQSAQLQRSGKLVAGLYGGGSDVNITLYVPEVWSKLAQAHRCVCMFWQYCRDELPRRLQHPTQSSCCTQTTIQSQRSTVFSHHTYLSE